MKTLTSELMKIDDLELEAFKDTQQLCEYEPECIDEASIYFLQDEEQILEHEIQQAKWLNQGSPALDEMEELLEYSKRSLSNSKSYPDERKEPFATAYIQVLMNVRFNDDGCAEEKWKTVKSVMLSLNEIDPMKLKDLMYKMNTPYSKYTRLLVYSPYLCELVGVDESQSNERSFTELDEAFPNIKVAIPKASEVDNYVADESLYDYANREISSGLKYGLLPYECLEKGAYQHWEMTRHFLEEVKPTLSYGVGDISTSRKYETEEKIIDEVNQGLSIEKLEEYSFEELTKVLFVARSKFSKARINDKAVFNLVVAIANSKDPCAEKQGGFELVDDINNSLISLEDLSFEDLEIVMQTVWSKTSGKSIEDKDLYFKAKSLYYKNKKLRSLKCSA